MSYDLDLYLSFKIALQIFSLSNNAVTKKRFQLLQIKIITLVLSFKLIDEWSGVIIF